MLITGAGIVTGKWQNSITKEEYLIHHERMNTYGHPTSTESVRKFNDESTRKKTSGNLYTKPQGKKMSK